MAERCLHALPKHLHSAIEAGYTPHADQRPPRPHRAANGWRIRSTRVDPPGEPLVIWVEVLMQHLRWIHWDRWVWRGCCAFVQCGCNSDRGGGLRPAWWICVSSLLFTPDSGGQRRSGAGW